MFQHVTIERIDGGIVDVGREHTLAQIVEHHHAGNAAEPAEGFFVQLGPGLRTGLEYQKANRLAAIAQRQDEQSRAPVLAAARVSHHWSGAVIHLSFLSRCGLDDDASFRRLAPAQLANKTLHALIRAGETTTIYQILPDGLGVATAGESRFDHVSIHFAGASGWTATGFR
jgi:hypothetical protein